MQLVKVMIDLLAVWHDPAMLTGVTALWSAKNSTRGYEGIGAAIMA